MCVPVPEFHLPSYRVLFFSLHNHLAISHTSFSQHDLISKTITSSPFLHNNQQPPTPQASTQPHRMGSASSRPAKPASKPQTKANVKQQKSSRPAKPASQPRTRANTKRQDVKSHKPQNNSRLSRPFDPNVPLYFPPSNRPSGVPPVPPVDPARYQDAFAQLTSRSKQKPAAGKKSRFQEAC